MVGTSEENKACPTACTSCPEYITVHKSKSIIEREKKVTLSRVLSSLPSQLSIQSQRGEENF